MHYQLAISFDAGKARLSGTARLLIDANRGATLLLPGIEATGIILKRPDGPPSIINHHGISQINIPAAKVQQELYISYRKTVLDEDENHIGDDGITLLENWYPQPVDDVVFSVSATLPHGFKAICESDYLEHHNGNEYYFSFSMPTQSIHFIAGPYRIKLLSVRQNLFIYTYLFAEDEMLADAYLQAAAEYIRRYEKIIGPYPFNHFAIVENRRPTGYGMAGFTLLGQRVIKLPFIIKTSLGHEILHCWFGNGVRVDDSSANWSEGLTSYMSDWAYREEQNQGALHRKENILSYLSYVEDDNTIPLDAFRSASHNQPMADAVRSVGYIKGAMLFHELKNRVGDDIFSDSISLLAKRFHWKKVGWADIKNIFAEVSQLDLDLFFQERLRRSDIPDIDVENIEVHPAAGAYILSFTVVQKTAAPYDLILPIRVITHTDSAAFKTKISQSRQTVEVHLDSSPQQLLIDPDYDMLRKLDWEERVPVWSFFMGPVQATVIITDKDEELYQPFLDAFAKSSWTVKKASEIANSELAKDNLIFLGTDNLAGRSLFALPDFPSKGFALEVRHHPLNNDAYVLLVYCSDKDEMGKAIPKLPHYGKYSSLRFHNGINSEKNITQAGMGQQHTIESAPLAIARNNFLHLAEITKKIADSQIIYVGETHTSMTDHFLQLLVVEELYKQNRNLAIGLEMFPQTSQEVLDHYIFSTEPMSEEEFLKRSHYFSVWSYDYRYYRDIIRFAKKNSIPLVGLNIDRSIVASVFKNGSTDMLSQDQRALLPVDRDLALPGYSERLFSMHDVHMQGGHGSGDLGGFVQAQGIWDEVMAQNIVHYLQQNPGKRIIVLAGSQHTRDDSGIPPRVARQIEVVQSTLLGVAELKESFALLADYYVFLPQKNLAPAGKIGVTLEEKMGENGPFLEVLALSPHSKAEKSGLRVDDRLLSINNYSVTTLEDVRIAMIDAKPQDSAAIEIERTDSDAKTRRIKVFVELSAPQEEN